MSERYQQAKHKASEAIASTKLALGAGISLFTESPSNPTVRRKTLYDELARSPIKEPLNREDTLYNNFLSVLNRRQIPASTILHEKAPYWQPDTPYNIMEIVGTSAQFTDQHKAPLPKTTLPPRKDMETLINRVLNEPEMVTVDQQFDMLLDITGNKVIGAANLVMMATRYMSRFADSRAYPTLTIEGRDYIVDTPDSEINGVIRKWNERIAKFETYTDSDKNDGLGDGYYFWSHLFGALSLNSNGLRAKAMSKVFERGTEFMIFAKYTIARRKGDVLPHFEASELGKTIGLSLVEQAKQEEQEKK